VFHSVGVFNRGAQVNHTFDRATNQTDAWTTNWMRKWMAATVHNQLQEHKALAQAEGVGTFSSSNRLNVLLTNHSLGIKSGAEFRAPMHKQKRKDVSYQDVLTLTKVVKYAIAGKKGVLALIYNTIKLALQTQQPDITITYRTSIENLSSNEVARNVYGAMTLASLYKATGHAIYDKTTKAVFKLLDLGSPLLYGKKKSWGDQYDDPIALLGVANSLEGAFTALLDEKKIFALYHGYALYLGNYLAGEKYGMNADNILGQNRTNIFPINGLNSHFRYLELYDPLIGVDAYKWVPVGLFYDLMDNTNIYEPQGMNDQVSNISNAMMWNTMINPVPPLNMPSFKARLILTNQNQAPALNALFQCYGY
ncbi:MAG: hypothetical protein EAY68_00255, partial [Bacteroidetes bacterium]